MKFLKHLFLEMLLKLSQKNTLYQQYNKVFVHEHILIQKNVIKPYTQYFEDIYMITDFFIYKNK